MNLQIPAGTASHTRMRLKGKGVAKVSGYGHGDHYVHIRVDVPKSLDEKQRALISAFAELERDTPGTVSGTQSRRCKQHPLKKHK
jgi:DnaJ family protein A protein 3